MVMAYDDGDYEPAVPQQNIRVFKLKEGMKVQARFQVNYAGRGLMMFSSKFLRSKQDSERFS
jgi:hypothetical protein